MNEQRRPVMPAATVLETLEQSEADLAAGRWDDFLAGIDRPIAERTGAVDGEQAGMSLDL